MINFIGYILDINFFEGGWKMLYIILGIVAIIIICVIDMYNNLVRLRENILNSKGQIAAQVQSRWDALTNLIKGTEIYQDYEKDALMDIVNSRNSVMKNSSIEEIEKDDKIFNSAMGRLLAVVENYPELKASNLFEKTMDSINDYENKVRHSRMIYNDTVTRYNRSIMVFPNSLIASSMGFKKEEYFENEAEKNEMPSWNK